LFHVVRFVFSLTTGNFPAVVVLGRNGSLLKMQIRKTLFITPPFLIMWKILKIRSEDVLGHKWVINSSLQ
jgi:hypothetical protein